MSSNRRDIDVVWAPQPGSQELFLKCPIFETLYEGTRGPGKTDALLMDFVADTGRGFGPEWRGILFRKSYPELADVITKSKKWYKKFANEPTFNEATSTWTWPDGEQLLFRHIRRPEDYDAYHGHAYPWIGFEELTTWPTPECYTMMMSCCRSTHPEVAARARVRATTNPYGVGHNWVKNRFQLPVMRNRPIMEPKADDGGTEPPRMAIHGHIGENRILLKADPGYIDRIRSAARNQAELKAWMEGSWDIVAGGMFDDVWDARTNVVPSFPARLIPRGWRIDRALDWGSSKPFSVGWWLESDGEPIEWEGRVIGPVKGDLIRFMEWYGWTGKRNEGAKLKPGQIAQGILEREADEGLMGRVLPGPADHNIFSNDVGPTAESLMLDHGVAWEKAVKGPGSRKNGWEVMREMFANARPAPGEFARTDAGLFVTSRCEQFQLTIPVLSRLTRDPDDIDSDAEDHIADETRYRVRRQNNTLFRRQQ